MENKQAGSTPTASSQETGDCKTWQDLFFPYMTHDVPSKETSTKTNSPGQLQWGRLPISTPYDGKTRRR